MMEGAFYQEKRNSPTALAIVVLIHGAGLTALALAKMDVGARIWDPPIMIENVPLDEPPPPNEVEPPKADTPRTNESFVDRPEPIRPVPLGQIIEGPVGPPPLPFQDGPVIEDPPAPLPVLPVEKPRTIVPARAKANLASYVSDEDYPSTAARNEEQGTTRFRLAVGPDGRVKDCTVTGSSGSSALDSTTCRLMRQRARFKPATGGDGNPTGDSVTAAIRWVLPSD